MLPFLDVAPSSTARTMQHHEDHAEQEEPKSGSSSVAGGDDHSHDHSSYHSHEDSHDHSHGHSHDHSHGSSHGHSHSHGENATGPSDIEPETKESGEENPDNPHSCGPQCGHPAVLHDGHVGYLKDGTLHCVMQTIDGKRITEIHSPSPHHDSKCARDHNVPAKEIHFDSEEHKRHRVKHDDHYDYLIGDSIFSEDGRHHGHLDVLSANEIAIAQANRNRYRGGLQKRRFSLKGTRPNFVSQIRADGELPPEERALTCCGSAQTERKKRSKSNDACANCCAPETGCCAVAMKQGDAGRFLAMIFLTGAYFLVELIVGYIIESLALQADAYHMLSDIIALCIGFSASVMATLPSTRRFTFGFVNMEVVGALVNSTFLLSTCLQITLEAATRLDPSVLNETAEVLGTRGTELLIVAVVGLVINIAGLFIFGHGHSHGEHGHSHGGGHGHSHGGHSDGNSDDDCSDSEGDDSHDHDHDHAHDHDHGHSHGHHGHGHSRGHHGHGHSHGNGHDDGHGHSHGHSHGHNDDSAHGHNDDNAHGHGSAHGHGDSHEQDDSNGQGQGQFNILSSESGNMNIQAVLLHVLGDALGSVGVIISALVISYGGTDPRRCYIDPVMSLVIVIIILTGTIPVSCGVHFITYGWCS